MSDFRSAHRLQRLMVEGQLGARELIEATLAAAESEGSALNSFVHLLPDRALAAAAESDRRLQSGTARPLEGVPLTVKDSIWIEGVEAADGSRAKRGFIAPATDLTVARAIDAGAVVFAKTANPELCLYGNSHSELHGPTRNPWRLDRTAGGSSSGAGAALAAGLGPLALGSDGGGSLRIPAAFCGIVAHKPTNGLVPHWPQVSTWPTLSTIGPMARTVADLQLLLGIVAGHEPADFHSVPSSPYVESKGPREWRVAVDLDRNGVVPIEPRVAGLFADAVRRLEAAGVTAVHAGPERSESGVASWLSIASSEANAAFAGELAGREELLEEDTRAFLAVANRTDAAELAGAYRRRIEIHAAYADLFARTDTSLLLTPALGLEAFSLDLPCPTEVAGVPIERPYDDWQGHLWDANLAGLPACVIPIGLGESGLPVGLQIVGPRFSDAAVLAAAAAFEEALGFEAHPPPSAAAGG